MITVENGKVYGFEEAIRGARNPLNSWALSDSKNIYDENEQEWHYEIGEKDLALLKRLVHAGPDHGKFMRMITVSCDITAPFYWWKEMDQYKVGTVTNSCSTMHKLTYKPFEVSDFSHDHLSGETMPMFTDGNLILPEGGFGTYNCSAEDMLQIICDVLNKFRDLYITTRNKKYWWQMIQLLPSSYNQKRTWTANFQVLRNIYHARKDHKLDEWKDFCKELEGIPYSELIMEE